MRWPRFIRPFSHRLCRDAELARDIQFYLDAETEDNIRRGMDPAEARQRARKKFGNTTLIREEVYTMHATGFLEVLAQDMRYGLRQLRRSPGFTAVAALTLALGIGVNTSIFSVVNSVLLRPLPYKDPERLTWVAERFTRQTFALGPDFVAWRRSNQVFEQLEGYHPSGPSASLFGLGEPIPVRWTEATIGFFQMLDLEPVIGRAFRPEEGADGQNHVALLDEKLWRSQFGASPDVLGKTVHLENTAYTVIGVMPSRAEFAAADVWTPLVIDSPLFSPRARPMPLVSVIGRIKTGVTFSQADSDLSRIAHGIDQEYLPGFAQSRDRRVDLVNLHTLLAHVLRHALVISEIALSLVLLIGAGLLAKSFLRLTSVRLGFNPDRLLTAQISRPFTNGLETPSPAPFFNAVLRQMRALPGVEGAAAVSRTPLSACGTGPVKLRGAEADLQPVCTTNVSPDYFAAMQIPLLEGRSFDDHDSPHAQPVVMVNESLAREAFPGRDALGRQIGVYTLGGVSWRAIVGIAADTRNSALQQSTLPELFVPYPQAFLPMAATFVLRTGGDPTALAGAARKAVEAVDPNQSLSNLQTLDAVVESATSPQWFRTMLLGLFALLALALAAIGVFGVMAYSVSQRTHEIGVRVALGARPENILALVVRQGLLVAALGLAIGLLGALSLTRFLSSLLYQVQPRDFTTFAAALLLLTGTALFACYLPARRAARVDPVIALRTE
jgi:hypothetical protein